ncbi:hypothetical protein [Sphaerisporangium krabiense]|uniref:Uncharacterized protein n=1 Tax=Sphaerisporangium krabiense TaxID=763782 RepID=A0A7W8Z2Q6_9ACTN|nr:hypothetical protein [Sphaerisporangium krabiense]MBB5626282.1 hypothetical protein [Sphaerisporangium krabiense]
MSVFRGLTGKASIARHHRRVGGTTGGSMVVNADLAKILDKEFEDKSLPELIKAPVSALAGVSEGDAKLLKEAFKINTVGDLGRNKYFRTAVALTELADSTK